MGLNCVRPKPINHHRAGTRLARWKGSTPELTPREKEVLRSSWRHMEESIADIGVISFVGLFRTYPQTQEFFPGLKGLAKADLRYRDTLRRHSLRVMATMEKCMHRLDQPASMQTLVQALGARHCREFDAKVDYVDLLGVQFLMALKDQMSVWNKEVENAWIKLISIMTHHVKKGWLETKKQLEEKTVRTSISVRWPSMKSRKMSFKVSSSRDVAPKISSARTIDSTTEKMLYKEIESFTVSSKDLSSREMGFKEVDSNESQAGFTLFSSVKDDSSREMAYKDSCETSPSDVLDKRRNYRGNESPKDVSNEAGPSDLLSRKTGSQESDSTYLGSRKICPTDGSCRKSGCKDAPPERTSLKPYDVGSER